MELNSETIMDRLSMLGYNTTSADDDFVQYELDKICAFVRNYCNITDIPPILNYRIVDRVCAEFLFNKKNNGQLSNFDYDKVIKELREGDTTIKFDEGTPESRFNSFVAKMERGFEKWITPYRRLRW